MKRVLLSIGFIILAAAAFASTNVKPRVAVVVGYSGFDDFYSFLASDANYTLSALFQSAQTVFNETLTNCVWIDPNRMNYIAETESEMLRAIDSSKADYLIGLFIRKLEMNRTEYRMEAMNKLGVRITNFGWEFFGNLTPSILELFNRQTVSFAKSLNFWMQAQSRYGTDIHDILIVTITNTVTVTNLPRLTNRSTNSIEALTNDVPSIHLFTKATETATRKSLLFKGLFYCIQYKSSKDEFELRYSPMQKTICGTPNIPNFPFDDKTNLLQMYLHPGMNSIDIMPGNIFSTGISAYQHSLKLLINFDSFKDTNLIIDLSDYNLRNKVLNITFDFGVQIIPRFYSMYYYSQAEVSPYAGFGLGIPLDTSSKVLFGLDIHNQVSYLSLYFNPYSASSYSYYFSPIFYAGYEKAISDRYNSSFDYLFYWYAKAFVPLSSFQQMFGFEGGIGMRIFPIFSPKLSVSVTFVDPFSSGGGINVAFYLGTEIYVPIPFAEPELIIKK